MMHAMSGMDALGFGPACDGYDSYGFEDEIESLLLPDILPQDGLQQLPQHHAAAEAVQALFGDSFDRHDSLELAMTGRPEEITGQTLALKMEDDKREFFHHLDKSASVMDPHPNHTSVQAVETEMDQEGDDVGHTQQMIREMEEFLSQYEAGSGHADSEGTTGVPLKQEKEGVSDIAQDLLSLEQQHTLQGMDVPCPIGSSLLDEQDTRVCEEMLDTLLSQVGEAGPLEQTLQSQAEDLLQLAVDTESLNECGFATGEEVTVNSLSQHPTGESGNVIIVITSSDNAGTNHSFAGQEPVADFPSSGVTPSPSPQCDDDSDGAPEPETSRVTSRRRKPGRKPEARTSILALIKSGKLGRSSVSTIKERKERKKLQNVEAARRYRDKKRHEQCIAEMEEAALLKKNMALKAELREIESEKKTLKKLMVELGLLKIVTNCDFKAN